jgi:ubiquinone/menaquinone biosynthesis C-methylase UbiE
MTVQESGAAQRAFGQKYKADDYAEYYSQKHGATLGRSISNFAERQMIRRSLMRIRRRKQFESVLDCPSGTGRFLPTLSTIASRVITMDTSDAMLREGRRHFGLFAESPQPAAGSAFELPLIDNAVDVVLCSRLLHHFSEHERRVKILSELARVARVGVVVSFFDASSYRAWKRRRKIRRAHKLSGRHAVPRATCVEEARSAGLELIGMNALLRFHTEVTAAAFLC